MAIAKLPRPQRYIVTPEGAQTYISGSRLSAGTAIDLNPGIAASYLAEGLIEIAEPAPTPKARAKRSEVHQPGRTEPAA